MTLFNRNVCMFYGRAGVAAYRARQWRSSTCRILSRPIFMSSPLAQLSALACSIGGRKSLGSSNKNRMPIVLEWRWCAWRRALRTAMCDGVSLLGAASILMSTRGWSIYDCFKKKNYRDEWPWRAATVAATGRRYCVAIGAGGRSITARTAN